MPDYQDAIEHAIYSVLSPPSNDDGPYGDGPTSSFEMKVLMRSNIIKTMDHDTIEQWYLTEAYSRFDPVVVGQMYAGTYNELDGFPAIKYGVVRDASQEITRRIENMTDPVRAFTDTVNEWPRQAQAHLAAYEGTMAERDNPQYVDDATDFAESRGALDGEYDDHDIDLHFSPNPFTDEDLSSTEARAVMEARSLGEELEPEQLAEIDIIDNFLGWLDRTGDVTKSVQINQFDSELGLDVIRQADPPSEWPDGLDPHDIRIVSCRSCDNTVYEVSVDGEPELITDTGHEGGEFFDSERVAYETSSTDPALCGECLRHWEDARREGYIVSPEGVAKVVDGGYLSLIETGEELQPPDEVADTDFINGLRTALQEGHSPDWTFTIMPDQDYGDVDEQAEAIRALADPSNDAVTEGTVLVYEYRVPGDTVFCVSIPRDDPDVARETKNFIEGGFENVRTARAD